jgi:hypothetical protein
MKAVLITLLLFGASVLITLFALFAFQNRHRLLKKWATALKNKFWYGTTTPHIDEAQRLYNQCFEEYRRTNPSWSHRRIHRHIIKQAGLK